MVSLYFRMALQAGLCLLVPLAAHSAPNNAANNKEPKPPAEPIYIASKDIANPTRLWVTNTDTFQQTRITVGRDTLDARQVGENGRRPIYISQPDNRMQYLLSTESPDLETTGATHDIVYGTAGSNNISTGDGDDIVYAGNGNDTVALGRGINSADGGKGEDTALYPGKPDMYYMQTSGNMVNIQTRDNGATSNDTLVNFEYAIFDTIKVDLRDNTQVVEGSEKKPKRRR